MYLAAIVLVAVLFIWIYRSQASTKYARQAIRNIPGPYNIPLLGCLQLALSMNANNVFDVFQKQLQTHGLVIKGWVFNRLFAGSADAELNEQILSSPTYITKMDLYGMFHEWLGNGLLVSSGHKWHSRRKIITPTFHFKILEQFLEVFDKKSSVLIECLAERADGRTAFDILPYMSSISLDIIVETAMGTKVNAQTDKNMPYTSAVHEMTALMGWRCAQFYLHSEFVFTLLHPFKKLRQQKLIRILHDFTKNVIAERRKQLEETLNKSHNSSSADQDAIGSGGQRMALLDVLLRSPIDGQPLTDEDIREEVQTFMLEGHDTTTSALSFTLHLLARHQQVQNKVWAEIRQVCGDDDSTPLTLMNLNELKYLKCVIKESLRLYPPVPFIGRDITEDFPYKHSKLGDGVIPAGTNLIISLYHAMRQPEYFKNPSDFIPERHENNNFSGSFSFVPFSAGPRNCIGQKFAMYEMEVVLIKILRAYELLPLGPPVEPIMSMVTGSRTNMHLGLRKRTSS